MISWNSKFLSHVELWFDEPNPSETFDIVMHRQAPKPVPDAQNEEFHTLMIDLTQPEDKIFGAFDRNTRSKINKAQKADAPVFKLIENPTLEQLDEFVVFYNDFAETKGLEKVFEPIMRACRDSGMMSFSQVCRDDQILVWHALISYGKRVTVTHSASHFRNADDPESRNIVGRANRFNHWQEMVAYKKKGLASYDMGGWYSGESNESLLMVNRFKEEFGGEKIVEFNARQERSLRAKAISMVRKHKAS
jgi:lipid II:glycine glycyltransferase (peptidoglycan interpeptide bridge formation enzyme)